MRFSKHFRQTKPNKFGYTPLYYDEKKEKRDLRNHDIKRELGYTKSVDFDAEDFRDRLSSRLKESRRPASKYSFDKTGNMGKRSTKIILLAILVGIIMYWQFFQ